VQNYCCCKSNTRASPKGHYRMINGDAIAQIVLEWGKPTLSGDRLIVPTFATYPSNSLVQAYVEGGRDRFVVSDGGGALKVVLGMGSASRTVHKLLSSFAKGTSVKVNSSGWIFLGGVTLKNLTSAISIVAEASREAAVLLLKHFNPKPAIDFRRDIEALLDIRFHDSVQKKGHLTGASNKLHSFDYLVRVNDNTLLALDAVVPDPSSINAAVVSHMDVKATRRLDVRQMIIYDDDDNWSAADLALLSIGAPSARFSSFSKALESLVA
jgi:hypothetical protein